MTYWLLLADAAHARVLSSGPHLKELKVIKELENPRGRGRLRDSTNGAAAPEKEKKTGMYAWDIPSTGRPIDQKRFALELSDMLLAGLNQRDFQKLAIIAPPEFLGVLKSTLPQRVHNSTVETLAKNLTKVGVQDLPSFLQGISLPSQ